MIRQLKLLHCFVSKTYITTKTVFIALRKRETFYFYLFVQKHFYAIAFNINKCYIKLEQFFLSFTLTKLDFRMKDKVFF